LAGVSGLPSISNLPDVGVSSPSMMRIRVVLPTPDGPMIAANCPAGISKFMSLKIGGSLGA